jgi:hypothetical protein
MVIEFFGISLSDAEMMMPTLVEKMGLGHPVYSTVCLPPIRMHDEKGKHTSDEGKAIRVPGFEKLRKNPQILAELSSLLGVPVTMTDPCASGNRRKGLLTGTARPSRELSNEIDIIGSSLDVNFLLKSIKIN